MVAVYLLLVTVIRCLGWGRARNDKKRPLGSAKSHAACFRCFSVQDSWSEQHLHVKLKMPQHGSAYMPSSKLPDWQVQVALFLKAACPTAPFS